MGKITTREKQISKTSFIGIAANLLLATFKAIVGLMANSIAIMLDAVNNYEIPIEETVEKYFDVDNLLSYIAFNIIFC